jgi:hypothetical protein
MQQMLLYRSIFSGSRIGSTAAVVFFLQKKSLEYQGGVTSFVEHYLMQHKISYVELFRTKAAELLV